MATSPTETHPSALPRDSLSLSQKLNELFPAITPERTDLLDEASRLRFAERIGERNVVELILKGIGRE